MTGNVGSGAQGAPRGDYNDDFEPPRKPRKKTRKRVPAEETAPRSFTPAQRLLILDSWQRSGLPANDFAPLIGVSTAALYK